jgi:DNA-binding CsgD family transcriptional regulator
MTTERMNLSMIFRNLNLNKREQEIVRLLLAGSVNKEIADSLGLSLNTIKGYMKLLTRKLGVNNRSGIIAAILAASAGDNRQSGNHT